MNYNLPHRFYCGVDLHARTMFTHVLDHKGKTVFEKDLPADPDEFLYAIKPFRKNLATTDGGLDSLAEPPARSRYPSGIEPYFLSDRFVGTERFLRRRRSR